MVPCSSSDTCSDNDGGEVEIPMSQEYLPQIEASSKGQSGYGQKS